MLVLIQVLSESLGIRESMSLSCSRCATESGGSERAYRYITNVALLRVCVRADPRFSRALLLTSLMREQPLLGCLVYY